MPADTPALLEHVLLPLANREDAVRTASALEPYQPEHVTALHVVENDENVSEETLAEQSEVLAGDVYEAVRTIFPDAAEHTAYSHDVIDAIFEAAEDVGASAIAYQSRGGSRLGKFLSGDPGLKLVTESDRPVIALPRVEPEG